MIHALIVGPRGIGKSTLIGRVLKELNRPLFGFETKKEDALADEQLESPIYIYEPGVPRRRSDKNLVGYCHRHHFNTIKGVFDRYSANLTVPVPEGHIVVMDELGFMEAGETRFCQAVLSLLDGDAPVIAAVKNKKVPFLDKIRSHPKCRCFYITEENRDILYYQVLDFMRQQMGEATEQTMIRLSDLALAPGRADLNYFIALHESRPSDSPHHSAAIWNKRAESWNKERANNRKNDERVESAVGYLKQRGLLRPEYDIADIGCGPGRFVAAFAKHVHSVVGLDLSEKMVEYGMEHIRQEGLENAHLRVCDFQTMNVVQEGYQGAFDVVFSSMTPAIHGMNGLNKSIEMSRKYCCDICRIYEHSYLKDQILKEVFGREPKVHWNGRWFYSLFNILLLMGYCPETSYETRCQEISMKPDEEYIESIMEHTLPVEERTREYAKKIDCWMKTHVDENGILTERIESCYGRILWDVRRKYPIEQEDGKWRGCPQENR